MLRKTAQEEWASVALSLFVLLTFILFVRGAIELSSDIAAVLIVLHVAADLKLRPTIPAGALSDQLSEILGTRCSTVMRLRQLTQPQGLTTAAKIKHLSRMLDRNGVAIEPDWRYAGWLPGPNDPIVVFKAPYGAHVDPDRPPYHRLKLRIDAMALAVAIGEERRDGGFATLKSDVAAAADISNIERARLLAYAFASLANPPKLARRSSMLRQ
jgi:hypothetical protein